MSDEVRIVEFRFPSGRIEQIEVPTAEQVKLPRKERPKIKRTNAHKHACKHVGAAIDIPAGCAGKQQGIWQCEIYGKCKPLLQVRGTPAMPSCAYCESYEPSPDPSLIQEIKSAGEATAKWIAAGRPTRTDERQREILSLCHACPHLRKGKLGEWCGVCGCYLKAKVMMSTEKCPLNPPRWTADS